MSGGAASGQRGTSYERELVNRLRQSGFGALRFPASGAATTRSVPDVMAARPVEATLHSPNGNPYTETVTELWGIELKSGKGTTLYVDGPEVMKLRAFGRRWGARVLLGARSTDRGTPTDCYLVEPDDARQTDGGNYGLPIDGLADRAFAAVSEDGVEVEP